MQLWFTLCDWTHVTPLNLHNYLKYTQLKIFDSQKLKQAKSLFADIQRMETDNSLESFPTETTNVWQPGLCLNSPFFRLA